MSLWTAKEAESATGGRAIGDWTCDGVSIDTRTLAPGDLFVALKDVRDGHDFVAMALEKGAGAALVTHVPEGVAEDAPLLIVEDVLRALEALGAAARARTQAKVVAVTGSVGKTSTKEMLLAIFADQGRAHASV
ncbi:MAG TPA: UDP-N-acetylmuramoyl-tripeptide--D-alanyl-D-alanine ligase, partial [Sulfitobacter sp.]|nr:UDP-N-acetylmuramoyl-tripeptide--D-alanyl-D-alanine ligase [Sulfitobacter sp.]